MENRLTGAILVELEQGMHWNDLQLPVHVAMTPFFTIDQENVPLVTPNLRDEVLAEDLEPFSARMVSAPDHLVDMSRFAILRTIAVRALETFNVTYIGNSHYFSPRITGEPPRRQGVRVEDVSFATQHDGVWQRQGIVKLGDVRHGEATSR